MVTLVEDRVNSRYIVTGGGGGGITWNVPF